MRAGAEAFESELGPWSCLGDKALRKEVRNGFVPSRACSSKLSCSPGVGVHTCLASLVGSPHAPFQACSAAC